MPYPGFPSMVRAPFTPLLEMIPEQQTIKPDSYPGNACGELPSQCARMSTINIARSSLDCN